MPLTRKSFLLGGAGAVAATLGLRAVGVIPSGRPTVLEFWGWQDTDERRDQFKAWTAAHAGSKVEFRAAPAVGAGTAAQQKFAAAVAGGKAPHVVDFDRFQVATFVNWRLFRSLEPHVRRDKYDLSRFAPAALEEATGFDGQLYGIPSSIDNRLLYWNKDAFAQAGLDPDRPPATWDELKSYAIRLTRRGPNGLERLGFHTQEGQASLHTFAWQTGGTFQSPDGKTATLSVAPNEDALQWLVGLMHDQAGWPAAESFWHGWTRGPQHPFLTGQLAMIYQLDRWAGEAIARYRPNLDFGVAPLPARRAGDPPLTWSGGYSNVMTRDNRNPDASWALIKWLASEPAWTVAYDGARERARATGGTYLPGMTGQPALDKAMYERYRTERPALDRVPELAVSLMEHTRFRELSIAASALWDGVTTAQLQAVSQMRSPRSALDEQNAGVQRALDQAWVFIPQR